MAPRANWKGYLRLSLVSCPIALYPASSLSEKVSFNRINRKTGNRLKQQNVDSETGDVVPREDIARGYEVAKGQYLVIEDEEIDAVQIQSNRTIEIDQFGPRGEIDDRFIDSPYYLAPDGKVGQDAFAVIRDTIAKMNMVAIGRVVLTRREHVIALEARSRGLLGLTLRYPYEVRDEQTYLEDIPDMKLSKDMLDLATHLVQTKSGHFDPAQRQRSWVLLATIFFEPYWVTGGGIGASSPAFGTERISRLVGSWIWSKPLGYCEYLTPLDGPSCSDASLQATCDSWNTNTQLLASIVRAGLGLRQRLDTGCFSGLFALAELQVFQCLVALFLGLLLIGSRRYQLALNIFVPVCAFCGLGFHVRSVLEFFSNDVGITQRPRFTVLPH